MRYDLFWVLMAVGLIAWATYTDKQLAELSSLQTTCYPLLEENKNVR